MGESWNVTTYEKELQVLGLGHLITELESALRERGFEKVILVKGEDDKKFS